MAVVAISPLPPTFPVMSGQRQPLADILNATNSPFRGAAPTGKRSRSHSSVQRELQYGQAPPAKKQMLGINRSNLQTPPRQQLLPPAEVFNKRPAGSRPTAFEQRLHAAREKTNQKKAAAVEAIRNEHATKENLEDVRTWQRHYRRAFPHFVFYLDTLPEEARAKCSKQISTLGAREEKFFSKAVTHVVTTRPIPAATDMSTSATVACNGEGGTINPSLLDKSPESAQNETVSVPTKVQFAFETTLGKRYNNGCKVENAYVLQESESRKQPNGNGDVLLRARELGMKIWALEKLQRMITTLFDADTGDQAQYGHNTRSNATAAVGTSRVNRGADLSKLLRNERLNGPSDRDPAVATKEMVQFKGPFIYIHDMEEKTRPVMVREYKKVPKGETGEWPQFHCTANGKCPFVEESVHNKQEREREAVKGRQRIEIKNGNVAPLRARATAATEVTKMQPPAAGLRKHPLAEAGDAINRNGRARADATSAKLCGLVATVPLKRASPESNASHGTYGAIGTTSRFYDGEPVASGVQPSNVTSAIRSQMISSTAAAPGAKAGTSREIHELKRKVLERNSGPSTIGTLSSHRMTDFAGVAGAEKALATTRVAKRKAQEKLGYINEDLTPSEEDDRARKLAAAQAAGFLKRKQPEKRYLKPGYCENCREKFDDFDQHTLSKKHRRFAVTTENWAELDGLLKDLVRPLKQQ